MTLIGVLGFLALLNICSAGYLCHGDLRNLHPTGMHNGGVAASNREVDIDYSVLNSMRSCYYTAGTHNCVQPSLIAALASRESRGGKLLQHTNGYGDHHHAYGILQCDVRYHNYCTSHAWDSCDHIDMMVRTVLVPYINQVGNKHPSWRQEVKLKGGVAAYNSGVSNVQTINGMDIGTTGNDYSNDVIARAQHLITAHGWQ